MTGPDGLRLGMVVYKEVDLSDVDENWVVYSFDTAVAIISWPGGGFAWVDLDTWGLVICGHEKDTFVHRNAKTLPKDQLTGLAQVFKVTESTVWFRTQVEAILAASEEEKKYAEESINRARIARRIAEGKKS